jgi:hypothetical protein
MFRLRKFTEYLKESELYPQVNNGETYMIDGEDIVPLICSLMSSMMDYDCNFKGEDIPEVYFNDGPQEGTKPAFRRTGSYFPDTNSIIVYVHGRSLKDVLRSFAHEFIHADQCKNKGWDLYPAANGLGEGSSEEAEEIEADAYLRGNLGLRRWEDRMRTR